MIAKFSNIARAVGDALSPMVTRPYGRQVAALCTRKGKNEKEVLLVTSRRRGRWIVPKGWPMEGKTFPETALEEAWEEAGVRKGHIKGDMLGTYTYKKLQRNGTTLPCVVDVYSVKVDELKDKFPESKERTRCWVPQFEAVDLVSEPELKEIIRLM